MKKISLLVLAISTLFLTSFAQEQNRWQQHVNYVMNVNMNVENHKFTGVQKLTYTNNSPDTLTKVYYHLYFNAFQPGSMMDTRSLNIIDPDSRVGDRIAKLSKDEIGYQKINSLKQDGKDLNYQIVGTIAEVNLKHPILPHSKTIFDMEFEGQVPVQIRRSGRNSKEDISYSMSQWYPKLSEYDYEGWHANPYIAREFHGVWGDFDVSITIDSKYVLGGSGYLQNGNEIGFGYEDEGVAIKNIGKTNTWHFIAPNVHDFMWAADPDYIHTKIQVPDGPMVHMLYDKNTADIEAWEQLPAYMVNMFGFMNKTFGKYPYKQFSVVHGGDGGMEYPMSTLVTGNRNIRSLVGVTIHEAFHSWYQGVLGFNESKYPWMDEGFTSWASAITSQHIFNPDSKENPSLRSYPTYFYQALSGAEEPLTTHADHYITNRSYGINSYVKGSVILTQLGYVIGEDNLMKGMRRFFTTWKFRHPTANDHMRVMEKVSGLELDWYYEHFVNTTNQIDYKIDTLIEVNNSTQITLRRIGEMMMPIDLEIEYIDGTTELRYIPLRIMRGEKPVENNDLMRITEEDWPWTHPTYEVQLSKPINEIKRIEIDPSKRMADVDSLTNKIEVGENGELIRPLPEKKE
ncbi:MAG: M1 family metallopeptidase [Cyclobacteriaceae bacterium]|nr:M1 family metallopeptidase [Cyclobacteriaceae bacterium]